MATLTIGVRDFGTHLFGTIKAPAFEFSRVAQTFFGVVGEQNLYGKAHFRYLTCPLQLTGYATHLTLQQGVATMALWMGTTGTLTYNLGGGDSTPFTQCIFEGFEPEEEPWKDGSGVNGWNQRGTLKFRQVAS